MLHKVDPVKIENPGRHSLQSSVAFFESCPSAQPLGKHDSGAGTKPMYESQDTLRHPGKGFTVNGGRNSAVCTQDARLALPPRDSSESHSAFRAGFAVRVVSQCGLAQAVLFLSLTQVTFLRKTPRAS